MDIGQENLVLFLMMGIMVTGFPVVAACSSHCVSGGSDVGIPQGFYGTLYGHSFIQAENFVSAFYVVPLIGFYLLARRLILPAGFAASLFRPPRIFPK